MHDKVLLQKLKKGNKEAFEKIYIRYSKILGYFLLGYLKSAEDTEELIQDTFLKIWENRKTLDPNQNFKNYLFKISKNEFLNKLRRKNVENSFNHYFISEYIEGDNSTENSIILSDYEDFYNKIVAKLPPKRRNIFLLSRSQGLTYEEIAKALNISRKTVEKQMSEALRFLRAQLLAENNSLLLHLCLLIVSIM